MPFERDSEFYFKAGLKHAYKKSYEKALKYLNTANSLERFNLDYLFNLAGIYAECGQIEKSNEVLKEIFLNIDPTISECYFGIACNYYDLEDYDRAVEYFEKYIKFDPDGEYAEDVNGVLFYLKLDSNEDLKKVHDSSQRNLIEAEDHFKSGALQ